MEDELERASSGHARALMLRGDVGLGKTRLVIELIERNVQHVRTLRASCNEQVSVPYLPIVQLIEQLAGSGTRASARRSRDLVERLTRVAGDGAEAEAAVVSGMRGSLFVDVVRTICDSLAEAETLCVIEDVQWADRDTSDMLLALSDTLFATPRHLPLLLVFTERTGAADLDRAGANLERRTNASTLQLRPLDELKVDELIRACGVDRPSRSLVRMMFELSAGNPLYVRESLLRIQQLNGFVERPGGVDTRVSASELGPPEDLVKLVERRLNALSPDTIELLTLASVMRGRIEREILTDVLDRPVDAAIALALSNGLFIETTDGLEFAHPLSRRVLSERPAREERRAMHASASRRHCVHVRRRSTQHGRRRSRITSSRAGSPIPTTTRLRFCGLPAVTRTRSALGRMLCASSKPEHVSRSSWARA